MRLLFCNLDLWVSRALVRTKKLIGTDCITLVTSPPDRAATYPGSRRQLTAIEEQALCTFVHLASTQTVLAVCIFVHVKRPLNQARQVTGLIAPPGQ